MYDEAQDLRDFAASLEERFGCDTVNVSLWDDKAEYRLEWEDDDRDILEQLDGARDIVENKLDPDHEPDNVDVSMYEDRLSISVGYDLSEDTEDETDDETESETDEE
ncbi:hypothetical protein HVTV-2_gp80 [Haloarcula virus HVTV-2]|nr:hypothetical protein HVTV-2_gp80 [Haloarcula virus HVTV-2]